MWINFGSGLLINASTLEGVWRDEKRGLTLFYLSGMGASLMTDSFNPAAITVLGDAVEVFLKAIKDGTKYLDLSYRN